MITKSKLTVTIDHELMETLQNNAKADNRPLSNYVETLLYKVLAMQSEEE